MNKRLFQQIDAEAKLAAAMVEAGLATLRETEKVLDRDHRNRDRRATIESWKRQLAARMAGVL